MGFENVWEPCICIHEVLLDFKKDFYFTVLFLIT